MIPRVDVILGPSASGKSAAALIVAEKIGGEIVVADSMKVYRGMDVGTAKPSAEARARVPHHLVDVLEPEESFSVKRFVDLADEAVAGIVSRGRRPLVVGGSALYLKAFMDGIFGIT